MMEWLNQLMQPQNMNALASQLAQKSPPPMEALAGLGAQGAGTPQMSQVPGAPGSFAEMMQGANAAGYRAAPQMSVDPNAQVPQAMPMAAPAPQGPVPGLRPEQIASLMQQQGGDGNMPRAPGAPGVIGGSGLRDQQRLQAGQQGPRLSLAQLLYGKG
jgi:hypothetical protein